MYYAKKIWVLITRNDRHCKNCGKHTQLGFKNCKIIYIFYVKITSGTNGVASLGIDPSIKSNYHYFQCLFFFFHAKIMFTQRQLFSAPGSFSL